MLRLCSHRFRASTILAVLVALVVGCGKEGGSLPGSSAIVHRLIEEPSPNPRQDSLLLEGRVVEEWGFESDLEPNAWTSQPADLKGRPHLGGVEFCGEGQQTFFSRDVDLSAESVDALDLDAEGPNLTFVQICWAGPEQGFTAERCLQVPRGKGENRQLFSFPLLKHPNWSGQISRIRLSPLIRQCTILRQLSAVAYDLRGPELSKALKKSFRVTLPEEGFLDTRNALMAPPGVDITRTAQLGTESKLRFAYGLEPGVRSPVTFKVVVWDRSDKQRAPVTVFERTIQSDDVLKGSGWFDAEVDLEAFNSTEVDLLLQTESPGDLDLRRGFPFWGHPELLDRVDSVARPSLLLLSVDTLRRDHLSLYGYDRPTSPMLDLWARRCGVVFETAVAAAPWTIPSHASMLTGLDALSHGVNHDSSVPDRLTTLAEVLRQAGYQTVAITGGGYLSEQFGFSQGFDRYLHWRGTAGNSEELQSGLQYLHQTLKESATRPYFVFFHTYEVHTPYHPREPFLSRFSTGEGLPPAGLIGERNQERVPEDGYALRREWIWIEEQQRPSEGRPFDADPSVGVDYYDSGVAYADAQFESLFELLQEPGIAESMMVVFTSDHGEALGEDGLVGHAYLTDSNLLVPLIISLPECAQAGQRRREQVRSIDIFPTVLDFLEIEVPKEVDGESFLPLLLGDPVRFAPEAWSYAARSNHGVALRLGNRWSYRFNNSAWPDSRDNETLLWIGDHEAGAAREERSLERLRDHVKNRMSEDLSGLVFHFNNSSEFGIHGRVSGASIDPSRIKAWDHSAQFLSYSEWRTMNFNIPAGEAFDVLLESPGTQSPLVVRIGFERKDSPEFRAELDLSQNREGWVLGYSEGSWSLDPDNEAELRGLEIRWKNLRPGTVTDPAKDDRELLEQLRTLGYLN